MSRSQFIKLSPVGFSMVSVLLLSLVLTVFAEAEETKNAPKESESDRTRDHAEFVDPDSKAAEYSAGRIVEEYLRKTCSQEGMVLYHGKCMKPEEKMALFEAEILHVEMLLDEARRLYRTSVPGHIASVFKQTKEFLNKFEDDTVVDERIERKVLIVLGFLHKAAGEAVSKMREEAEKETANAEPFTFLERQGRLEDFSSQVHVPLMRLLAWKTEGYKLRHGEKEFERVMVDNNLSDILHESQ